MKQPNFRDYVALIVFLITNAVLFADETKVPPDLNHMTIQKHGLVGLRPLPRTEKDWKSNHGGSWQGTPTYEMQKGKYPFVAAHIDTVKGWLDGDFKTKRVFFEHYWGSAAKFDDLDPQKNQLVKKIKKWEEKGGIVEHILICREYDLVINRGYKDAKPGPFKEDTRILYEKDIDDIRSMFKKAHKQEIRQPALPVRFAQ